MIADPCTLGNGCWCGGTGCRGACTGSGKTITSFTPDEPRRMRRLLATAIAPMLILTVPKLLPSDPIEFDNSPTEPQRQRPPACARGKRRPRFNGRRMFVP